MTAVSRIRSGRFAGIVRVAEAMVVLVVLLVSVGLVAVGALAFGQSFRGPPTKADLTLDSGTVERAGPEFVRYHRRSKTSPVERIEENRLTVRRADGGSRVFMVPPATLDVAILAGLRGRQVSVRTFWGEVWTIEVDGRELATFAAALKRHEDGRPYARFYGPLAALSGLFGMWLARRLRRWVSVRRRALPQA